MSWEGQTSFPCSTMKTSSALKTSTSRLSLIGKVATLWEMVLPTRSGYLSTFFSQSFLGSYKSLSLQGAIATATRQFLFGMLPLFHLFFCFVALAHFAKMVSRNLPRSRSSLFTSSTTSTLHSQPLSGKHYATTRGNFLSPSSFLLHHASLTFWKGAAMRAHAAARVALANHPLLLRQQPLNQQHNLSR